VGSRRTRRMKGKKKIRRNDRAKDDDTLLIDSLEHDLQKRTDKSADEKDSLLYLGGQKDVPNQRLEGEGIRRPHLNAH